MSAPRALTLRQPWASLVAVGAKTIETRRWKAPASAIGQPLLIHAGAQREHHGKFFMAARDALPLGKIDRDQEAEFRAMTVPFGAVVASCQLIDCVPMVADYDDVASAYNGPAALEITSNRTLLLYPEWDSALDEDEIHDVTDQLPFGDFSPGRYAWLLDDVKPTTERCPRCSGPGVMFWRCVHCATDWIDEDELQQVQPDGHNACPICEDHDDLVPYDCLTCKTEGVCEPVPMRGRQGLWTPTW